MKYENSLNLFWMIIWAAVLVGAIVAIFWKPAIFGIAVLAATMFGVFLHDYIRVLRMK